MKRKKLLSVVLLLLVLIISLVIRFVDFLNFYHKIPILRNYNEAILVLIFNIICHLLMVILCYLRLSVFCNIYISGILSMVLSIVLLIIEKVCVISYFYLYVIGIIIPIVIICIVVKKINIRKIFFQNKLLKCEDEYFGEEIDSVITLDDILERESKKVETDELIESINVQEAPKNMTNIQIEKDTKKIQFIENPLPVPKKKEHKQMDYAISRLDENDDFDIQDMNGMDFYDIE